LFVSCWQADELLHMMMLNGPNLTESPLASAGTNANPPARIPADAVTAATAKSVRQDFDCIQFPSD